MGQSACTAIDMKNEMQSAPESIQDLVTHYSGPSLKGHSRQRTPL